MTYYISYLNIYIVLYNISKLTTQHNKLIIIILPMETQI
jgi:hypothetical protein